MNVPNLTEVFAQKKPFIAYITAGDKNLGQTRKMIFGLQKAGVDILELGLPFSDSLADGPVIQDSHLRALKSGVNLNKIFEMVKRNRKKIKIPLILMGAANLLVAFGLKNFFDSCVSAQIQGVIVPDLPPEEAGDFLRLSAETGVELIFLASVTSREDRLKKIADVSKSFIYCIAAPGVTGERQVLKMEELRQVITKIKSYRPVPVAVGFGVSTIEQIQNVFSVADGVIVGSAIVRRAHKSLREAVKFVRKIIEGID